MAAVCELNLKDWNDAVNTMGELILKYPVGSALKEALKAINLISVTKLHNYDIGINIYTRFIRKYPNNPIDPLLKQMIKDLQILKSKNLVIKSGQAYQSLSVRQFSTISVYRRSQTERPQT